MLYHALSMRSPKKVSTEADSPVILAIKGPWIADVRRPMADQEELARLWVADD